MLTKSLEMTQGKAESYFFDIRKHLVEYDDVVNRQREVIYARAGQGAAGRRTSRAEHPRTMVGNEVSCRRSIPRPRRETQESVRADHTLAARRADCPGVIMPLDRMDADLDAVVHPSNEGAAQTSRRSHPPPMLATKPSTNTRRASKRTATASSERTPCESHRAGCDAADHRPALGAAPHHDVQPAPGDRPLRIRPARPTRDVQEAGPRSLRRAPGAYPARYGPAHLSRRARQGRQAPRSGSANGRAATVDTTRTETVMAKAIGRAYGLRAGRARGRSGGRAAMDADARPNAPQAAARRPASGRADSRHGNDRRAAPHAGSPRPPPKRRLRRATERSNTFRSALANGTPWPEALLAAVGEWTAPFRGRGRRAARLPHRGRGVRLAVAGRTPAARGSPQGRIPDHDAERLLFRGVLPDEVDRSAVQGPAGAGEVPRAPQLLLRSRRGGSALARR